MKRDKGLLWKLIMVAFLSLAYWVFRFYLLDRHGMISLTNFLGILSLLAMAFAVYRDEKFLAMMVVLGFSLGFILAMEFRSFSHDPGGGLLSNAWLIWLFTFIVLVGLGFLRIFLRDRN